MAGENTDQTEPAIVAIVLLLLVLHVDKITTKQTYIKIMKKDKIINSGIKLIFFKLMKFLIHFNTVTIGMAFINCHGTGRSNL